MSRLENATSSGGADSLILADQHAVCDDCGALLTDWIVTSDRSILCLACADHWEPYHLDENLVRA